MQRLEQEILLVLLVQTVYVKIIQYTNASAHIIIVLDNKPQHIITNKVRHIEIPQNLHVLLPSTYFFPLPKKTFHMILFR